MSLASAILKYADELDRPAMKDGRESPVGIALDELRRSIAVRLRIIVEAASDNTPAPQYVPSHREMIEKAKAEFAGKISRRDGPKTTEMHIGESGGRFAHAVDGPEVGTTVPLADDMPFNARTYVGSHVYELRNDGKLHYIPQKTD